MNAQDLKQRVAARAEAPIARSDQAAPSPTVAKFLEQMRPEIARALPDGVSADRIARIALTEVRRTPKLAECSQVSFAGALMTCAQLGLEPGGATGEAYLIPFKGEVTFVLGYKGMVSLFWRHPLAAGLKAKTVYANDEFEYEDGLHPLLRHRPTPARDRGEPVAYYAVAHTTTGGCVSEVLFPADVERIRQRSNNPNGKPWREDYDAMARKSVVRQLFRWLPKSTELALAMVQDGGVRRDVSAEGIDTVPDFVEGEIVDDTGSSDGAA